MHRRPHRAPAINSCPKCAHQELDEAIRGENESVFRCLFCWTLFRGATPPHESALDEPSNGLPCSRGDAATHTSRTDPQVPLTPIEQLHRARDRRAGPHDDRREGEGDEAPMPGPGAGNSNSR